MAVYKQLNAMCEEHNRTNRMVTVNRHPLKSPDFWRYAAGNSFLINIGAENLRNGSLCDAIGSLVRFTMLPTIVINHCGSLENMLISAAQSGRIGRLFSISGRFRNYNLFSAFTPEKTLELIRSQAVADGYPDVDKIVDYAGAFIRIMLLRYPMNYNGFLALATRSDDHIKQFGAALGASQYDLRVIKTEDERGRRFREILLKFGQAFSLILNGENTNTCLASIGRDTAIYHIWAKSQFQQCFNREIAAELEQLVVRGIRFNLIFSDFSFDKDDLLLEFVKRHRSSVNVLGISTPDAVTVEPFEDFEKSICASLSTLLLVRTGNESMADFEKVLSLMGAYQHQEVVANVSRQDGIVPDFLHKNVGGNINAYERLRVNMTDAAEYPVIARGHDDTQIHIYHSMTHCFGM